VSHWIEDAEAVLRGESREGVQRIDGERPPVLDPTGLYAVVTPFLAAFMWAAAVFRETTQHAPLDGLALLLRLMAIALSVRAALSLRLLAQRLQVWLQRARYTLVLGDGGLLYRGPDGDRVVQREDVLAVREHGDWRKRGGRRWSPVYVVTRPSSGRLHLVLPPVFCSTPGILAEKLMRWRGVVPAPETPEYPPPAGLPSKLYDAVAAGERPADVAVIEHGSDWLRRGPYATVLLGLAVLDGFLRLEPGARAAIGMTAPFVLGFTLVVVPLAWILYTRRDIAPQKGLALILTPAEMLLRTGAGVHRVAWQGLTRTEIQSRSAWSILQGHHESRAVVFTRSDGESITYVEAFLGLPAEVVCALCDAYRRGVVVGRA
jgi:hypothetical protein